MSDWNTILKSLSRESNIHPYHLSRKYILHPEPSYQSTSLLPFMRSTLLTVLVQYSRTPLSPCTTPTILDSNPSIQPVITSRNFRSVSLNLNPSSLRNINDSSSYCYTFVEGLLSIGLCLPYHPRLQHCLLFDLQFDWSK